MYLHELPYQAHKALCAMLNEDEKWLELGTLMKFELQEMQRMKRVRSPTEELFNIWGNTYNHTVLELFVLLNSMNNYQAMLILLPFIDKKFHYLIKLEKNHQTLANLNLNSPKKSEPIKNLHFENSSAKICNVDSSLNAVSREDNESLLQHKPKSSLPRMLLHLGEPSTSRATSNMSLVVDSGGIPLIPYEDLRKSTKNWDQSTELGKGGFGTVYKGTWKFTEVAIKKIKTRLDNSNEQIKQSITELHCLNTYRHDNILSLYGYSLGGPEPCLVYQYMPGGCLDKRLHVQDANRVLKWNTRLDIAIGTARGLQFLHHKPLIHGDIKPANILLDSKDTPQIGDFGLAREGQLSNYVKVSRVQGTRPYLPAEFLRSNQFSPKVDTYSFGIVLFEIATALYVISKPKYISLRDYIIHYQGDLLDLKDRRMEGGETCFRGLIEIGKLCVADIAGHRPEMVDVFKKLEALRNQILCDIK